MEVPVCFQASHTSLRTGSKYRDLSDYAFSGMEKDFICQEIARARIDPKDLLIDKFSDIPTLFQRKPNYITVIAERYNMNGTNIKHWMANIKQNRKNNGSAGRPLDLDARSRATIKQTLIEAESRVHPLKEREADVLFLNEKIESNKRRKVNPDIEAIDIYNTSISKRTIESVKKRVDMRVFDRVPQDLTTARLEALTCARLAYIVMCFIWKLCRFLPSVYKWNADCTTFECRPDGRGELVCVVREKGDKSQVTSADVSGELNLLIKFFGLGNAEGEFGPVVLIIAIKDMPDEAYFAREVIGVNNTSIPGAKGWIYFCSTKGGTAEMWKHWFSSVCIPTIKNSAEIHDLRDEAGNSYRPFLCTDGEACILNQAFDDEVMDMFTGASIDYLKLGPSATKTQQPLDASDVFRGTKSGISNIVRKGVNIENGLLRKNVGIFLNEFSREFDNVPLTSKFKAKIMYSVMLIVYTLKKHLLPYQMQQGFIRTGNCLYVWLTNYIHDNDMYYCRTACRRCN